MDYHISKILYMLTLLHLASSSMFSRLVLVTVTFFISYLVNEIIWLASVVCFQFLLMLHYFYCWHFHRFVKSSTSSYIDVIVHLISLRLLPTVFLMIQSIATRNSNGDMMRPCLTPLVMLNQLLNLLSSITLHGKLS